ncbi:MAG: TIGR03915 family putative DNA repair protein [Bacteroidota bacterium]
MLLSPTALQDVVFDGTYAGLLSAVFECYRLKLSQARLIAEQDFQPGLFAAPLWVSTQDAHTNRVLAAIEKRGGKSALSLLQRCWLSEAPDRSAIIYRYIQRLVEGVDQPEQDVSDQLMHRLSRLRQQMGREMHRMHAFVRFQATPDDLYVALIEPDFDVLPLLEDHFAKRYPAQEWLIYDVRRRYGLYWDQRKRSASFITLDGRINQEKRLKENVLSEVETDYQVLWKTYFDAVDIPERRNLKLHFQHVPKRYWKYLVEKWG